MFVRPVPTINPPKIGGGLKFKKNKKKGGTNMGPPVQEPD